MSTRKVRYKKLNTKTPLPVLREDQVDPSEYESLTNETQIATGVEQAEENEYHLQAALKGVGASTDNEIPVPPPQKSELKYDELYPTPYIEPRNYIKFSDTVEETLNGSLYDMTTEDDEFLKAYNAEKPISAQLSEDDFERIMEVFEDTASEQAPFASVDNTVVSYEIMSQAMVHLVSSKVIQVHGKAVYEYWKARRQGSGNKSLPASLKFETHQEHDDMDPYVCFRRREVRQTRKTRARDVQIADKLKRLRRELEDGRQLVTFAHQREMLKRQMLKADRAIFEQRARIKETKIRLGVKTDDEDLINVKPPKRQKPEAQQPPRSGPHTQLRLAVRPDGGRSMEPVDLALLSDKLAEKENELQHDVELKVLNHRRWNQNWVDLTADPLPPVREEKEPAFRPAKTSYLITPPASSDSNSMELDSPPVEETGNTMAPYTFKGIPPKDSEHEEMPSFRRRVGRLGRLFIDRRPARSGLQSPPIEMGGSPQSDRWKYDHDDSDDEMPVYQVDSNSLGQLRFRSTIPPPAVMLNRRQGIDSAHPQANAASRASLPSSHVPAAVGAASQQALVPALASQAPTAQTST
ncbi:enhancer of polycomb-like-domain-containing protein [Xylariomycetidae sp. FL2044]|nr:enhancer of polycomb-like-domain-containing protein [Xylariomycetidae sp. FL2044]